MNSKPPGRVLAEAARASVNLQKIFQRISRPLDRAAAGLLSCLPIGDDLTDAQYLRVLLRQLRQKE